MWPEINSQRATKALRKWSTELLEVLLTSIMQVHMKVNKQVNLGLTNTLFVFKDLFLNLAQVKVKAVAC